MNVSSGGTDGKLMSGAQLYLYDCFVGVLGHSFVYLYVHKCVNVYLGCGGMFKAPATVILKWVLLVALLR